MNSDTSQSISPSDQDLGFSRYLSPEPNQTHSHDGMAQHPSNDYVVRPPRQWKRIEQRSHKRASSRDSTPAAARSSDLLFVISGCTEIQDGNGNWCRARAAVMMLPEDRPDICVSPDFVDRLGIEFAPHKAVKTASSTRLIVRNPVTGSSTTRWAAVLASDSVDVALYDVFLKATLTHYTVPQDIELPRALMPSIKEKKETRRGRAGYETSLKALRVEETNNESDSATSMTDQTISEASTSNYSAITEADILAAVLPPERASAVSQHLFSFFENLIEEKFALLRSHGPSGSSQRNDSGNQGSSTSKETNTLNQCGGPLRGDGDEGGLEVPDDDDGDDGSQRPIKKRRKEKDGQPKQKIACPFMKRFPEQYSTEKTCMGPGFGDIHRMKEHLRRRHFKERVCWRCQEQFDANQLLQQHMQADRPCKRKRIEASTGLITQFQMDDVTKIRSSPITSITQTWREIYMILFPEVDEATIPSPYFEPLSISSSLDHLIDLAEYEAYLKQHLPQRILSKLDEEFQIMAEHAKRRLVEIVNEESLETLKGYMQQKRAHPLPGPGQASGQNSDQPTDDIEFDFNLLGGTLFDSSLGTSFIPAYSDWQLEDLKEGTDMAPRLEADA